MVGGAERGRKVMKISLNGLKQTGWQMQRRLWRFCMVAGIQYYLSKV
jgi:hypothetical protein